MLHPVDEQHPHSLHRRARELAVLHCLAHSLVDGRTVTLRDHAANDLVDELVTLVPFKRLEHDLAVAELTAASSLLLVAPLGPRLPADRLEIRDARLMQVDVDVEARLQARDRDLHVHLRET